MASYPWADSSGGVGRWRLLSRTLPFVVILGCVALLVLWSEQAVPTVEPVVEADFQTSASPRPADLGDTWKRATLPMRFCHTIGCGDAFEIMRHQFRLNQAPRDFWAVYLPAFQNAVEVHVNGRLVGRAGQITQPVSMYSSRPVLIPVAPGDLHAGDNELILVFAEIAPGFGMSNPVYIGPQDALAPAWRVRYFTQVQALWIAAVVVVPILLLVAGIVVARQRDPLLISFAFLLLFYLLRSVNDLALDPWLSHDMHFFIYRAATVCMLAAAMDFVLRWVGRSSAILTGLLVAAAACLVAAMGWKIGHDLRSGINASNAMMRWSLLVIAPWAGWLIVAHLRNHWSTRAAWVAAALLATGAVGVFDVVVSWPPGMPQAYYARLGPPILVFAIALELVFRYVDNARAASRTNEQLARTVAAREAELRENFEQLRAVEAERTLLAERHRIMRDMHDGVGGRLAALSGLLNRQRVDETIVRETVAESLQDLRLVIDSLESLPDDMALALGMLRPRLSRWLATHGLELEWRCEVGEVTGFSPESVLAVYRIIQEACNNVVRHAGAGTIEVTSVSTQLCLTVSITDDGDGVRENDGRGGHGIANMRARARQLGGELLLSNSASGCSVCLTVPLHNGCLKGGPRREQHPSMVAAPGGFRTEDHTG
ncbi:MAG: hypothetical protein H6993_06175 [Pseudomonadales bacterium]|nr:hypothetical protein [Pseudomonadales bacterium]MCP5183531.1 hypothetical protein [Pseudomonadales bacterium]